MCWRGEGEARTCVEGRERVREGFWGEEGSGEIKKKKKPSKENRYWDPKGSQLDEKQQQEEKNQGKSHIHELHNSKISPLRAIPRQF